MEPIDILEMAKPEIEQAKRVSQIKNNMRKLYLSGMPKEKIGNVIQDLNLPLGLHMYLMGNMSLIVEGPHIGRNGKIVRA